MGPRLETADVLTQVLDWLLPVTCLGCGRAGSQICSDCAGPRPGRRWLAGNLPLLTAADRRLMPLVARWKDQGLRSLTADFAQLLAAAIRDAQLSPAGLVAVPSRRASGYRRGWRPVAELAGHTALGLGLPVIELLVWIRQPGDQRGLSDQQRAANMSNVFEAAPSAQPVLLVDDVITSGATLRSAAAALQIAGVPLVGCAALVDSRTKL